MIFSWWCVVENNNRMLICFEWSVSLLLITPNGRVRCGLSFGLVTHLTNEVPHRFSLVRASPHRFFCFFSSPPRFLFCRLSLLRSYLSPTGTSGPPPSCNLDGRRHRRRKWRRWRRLWRKRRRMSAATCCGLLALILVSSTLGGRPPRLGPRLLYARRECGPPPHRTRRGCNPCPRPLLRGGRPSSSDVG